MDQMIEWKCRELFIMFDITEGNLSCIPILFSIEDLLLNIQANNEGRLAKLQTKKSKFRNYLKIDEWCKLLNENMAGIPQKFSEKHIISHILGFRTAYDDGEFVDDEHGAADCAYMGMISCKLDKLSDNFLYYQVHKVIDRL